MSWPALVAVALLSPSAHPSADQLITLQTDGVSVSVPAAWEKKAEGNSWQFSAPSEDARFEFSVMKVVPKRTSRKCVDELMKALGKDWNRVWLGRTHAATTVSVEETGKVTVETRGYVGCDGERKWVLTWAYHQAKQARFSALADKVFESIRYGRAP